MTLETSRFSSKEGKQGITENENNQNIFEIFQLREEGRAALVFFRIKN